MFKSNSALGRAYDAVLWHEIRKLNTHLPKRRMTLAQLLKKADPALEAVDGSSILLKSAELHELAKLVPREYQDRIRLPIIILRRMDLGKSIYTVSGEAIEEFTVKKLLGITSLEYHEMYRERGAVYLYRPQVTELLRAFHSLVVIGFGVPKELADYGAEREPRHI